MFLSDLRQLDRFSFPDMQLIMQLLEHFKPLSLKSRANAKDPLFEEVVIPTRLKNFRADFSLLGAFLKPNQLMANYVSREIARGKCQTPPYTPYIVPDLSIAPWPVPTTEHTSALARWKSNKQTAKAGAPTLPFPTWVLLRLRFILTADLCGAWFPFGGIAAQLNNLSILLHLSAVESIAVAWAYDSILSAHLEELARARADRTAGAVDFVDLLSSENHRFKMQAIAQAGRSAPGSAGADRAPPKASTEAKATAAPKRKWLPRKQYLAQLAAEKRAAEAAATATAVAAASSAPPPERPPVISRPVYNDRRRSRSRPRSPRRADYGPRIAQPKQRNQRRR